MYNSLVYNNHVSFVEYSVDNYMPMVLWKQFFCRNLSLCLSLFYLIDFFFFFSLALSILSLTLLEDVVVVVWCTPFVDQKFLEPTVSSVICTWGITSFLDISLRECSPVADVANKLSSLFVAKALLNVFDNQEVALRVLELAAELEVELEGLLKMKIINM